MKTNMLPKLSIATGVVTATLLVITGCARWHETSISEHSGSPNAGHEEWRDENHFAMTSFLTDSKAQEIKIAHTNQAALGGGSLFVIQGAEIATSSNAPAVISSTGTLLGNAVNSAVKP